MRKIEPFEEPFGDDDGMLMYVNVVIGAHSSAMINLGVTLSPFFLF